MKWLSKLFSGSGASVIESTGNAFDKLLTSKEELKLAENELLKIKTMHEIAVKELMQEADAMAYKHEVDQEAELTKRHDMDMKSDSWLSKNVRPIILIFMTLVVTVLSFTTIFKVGLTSDQIDTVKEWIPFFQMIMLTVYGFYFGSRGFEKYQKIKLEKKG